MARYKINTKVTNIGVSPLGYRQPSCHFTAAITFPPSQETYRISVNNENINSALPQPHQSFVSDNDDLPNEFTLIITPTLVTQECIIVSRFFYIQDNLLKEIYHQARLPVQFQPDKGIHYPFQVELPTKTNHNINWQIEIKQIANLEETQYRVYTPVEISIPLPSKKTENYFNLNPGEYYQNFNKIREDSYFILTPKVSFTYGHVSGSGITASLSDTNDTPTRGVYSQIKNYYLNQYDSDVITIQSSSIDSFYGVVLGKNPDKGKYLDSKNLEIKLKSLDSNNNPTGSSISIIPGDSFFEKEKEYAPLYSGSLSKGVFNTGSLYGYVLYESALILLLPSTLDNQLNFNTSTSDGKNPLRIYNSISGSEGIYALASYRKHRKSYICRINGVDYNYSNNPSYRKTYDSGSFIPITTYAQEKNGRFRYESQARDQFSMIENPLSYITSIGLYDDKYNLLAVGKLSKALKKDLNHSYDMKINIHHE